tara:strand:+ start:2585 stop:3286 length:702 start_codon:yes stop_codon:yes gene_type:complete
MKIGLDWSGVIANVHEARRLVLMEMYGKFEDGDSMKGPYLGNDNVVPFSEEYRKMIVAVYSGRTPLYTFTKEWVLEDKSHQQDGTLLSVTSEEYEAMKQVLYERPEYAENIPEIPGAIAAIKELVEAGHDVSIVTSRGPGFSAEVVENWCKAHGLHVPMVFGAKDKTQVLHEYDLFVDDKKRQLAPGDDSLATLRMLFMHHYNAKDSADFIRPKNCGYIADWAGLLRRINAKE